MKLDIKSLTLKKVENILELNHIKKIHAKEIFRRIYREKDEDFTNCPKKEELEKLFEIKKLKLIKKETSSDKTKKFLFKSKNNKIESVLIPQQNKYSACLSTQVGCGMGCKFCVSGKNGFIRNLETWELIEQFEELNKEQKVYSIVFMGSGEPFLNYENVTTAIKILNERHGLNFSEKKIIVSTAGIVPGIKKFLEETNAKLAISLNATTNKLRKEIMPITNKYAIEEVLDACKNTKDQVMIEYILFNELNDTLKDAEELYQLTKNLNCFINLIPFNEHEFCEYKQTTKEKKKKFQQYLVNKGIRTHVRKEHGTEISAACGMLLKKVK